MQTIQTTQTTTHANTALIARQAPFVARAKDGDHAAFTVLLKECRSAVHATVYLMCGNWELAEDAVQSASLAAWLKIGTGFDQQSSFATWLTEIAMNCARYVCGRARKYVSDPNIEEMAVTSVRADYLLIAREQVERFDARFETLTDFEKQIFELHYGEGFRLEQIVESQVLPRRQVKAVLKAIQRHMGFKDGTYLRGGDPDYFENADQAPVAEVSELFDDVALDDGYGPDVAEPEWPADLQFGGGHEND